MINNPNMLEETLENFNKIPAEVIKESIKEETMKDKENNSILRLWKISCVLENSIEKAKYDKKYSEEVPIEEYIEEKEAIETVLNLIEKLEQQISNLETAGQALEKVYKAEIEKKDNIIKQYEEECRRFKAFCRRVRRDEKHDIDEFNQGQEHKCNQFLNLLEGEENWSYEGKYFNETDKEIEKLK